MTTSGIGNQPQLHHHDNFWDRAPVSAASPFERSEGNEDDNTPLSQFMHQIVFVDHN